MSAALRLILIRHGETMENASRKVQGQQPGILSEKGREQARRIAGRLRSERIEVIYSSDLARAFETALALREGRGKVRIVSDKRLREQDFGIYEGKPLITLLRQMKHDNVDFTDFHPPQGESAGHFQKRVKDFFTEIRTIHFGSTVAIVTHNGVITVLLSVLLDCKRTEVLQRPALNGAVSILNIYRFRNAAVETLNCIEHLV